MRRAAEDSPSGVIGTGAVLVALEQADGSGRWGHFWLRLGRGGPGELGSTPDGDVEPPVLPAPPDARWEGRALSPAMSAMCQLLREMADRYDMQPVPPGALALALVCEPTSAVAKALITGGATADELIAIVQEELLSTSLDGFADWVAHRIRDRDGGIADADHTRRQALRHAEQVARRDNRRPDDLDLLLGLASVLDDGNLAFASMIANVPADAVGQVRTLGSRSMREVLATEASSGVSDTWQLTSACVSSPSRACAAMLQVAGLTGPGVAADALVAREKQAGRTERMSRRMAITLTLKAAVMLAAPTLVVTQVLSTGHWWGLLLVVPVMACPPFAPLATTLVVAVVAYVLVAPLNAALSLVLAGLGVLDGRFQRRRLMARVGVGLTASEYTAHLARQRPSTARRAVARSGRTMRFRLWRLERRVRAASEPVR